MKENTKILTIALVSPLIAIVVIELVIGVWFMAIAPVAYVIMVLISFPLLFGLNALFHKIKVGLLTRLIISITFGVLGGAVVYLVLFRSNISQGAFSGELLTQYSSIGILMATITFLLYSFGPIRVNLEC